MAREIKGLLINPENKTITPVVLTDDYRDIYGLIDARTFDVVRLDDGDGIYLDDEGLLKDEPGPFFGLKGYGQPIAGKGLVLGSDDEGETQNVKITLEALTELVTWPEVRLTGFKMSEGYTEHPVLGKAWTIRNEAQFEPKKEEQ